MKRGIVKAIIWKEWICLFRRSFGIILFYIFLLVGTNLFLPSMYMEENIKNPWITSMLFNNAFILSASVIIAIGSVIISQSMGLERREGILRLLIGFGFPPEVIWLAQYVFACIFSYLCWLVCLAIYWIGIQGFYDIQMSITGESAFLLLFMFPVIAMFFLAFYAFLFWITRNQTTLIVYSILPGLIYLLSFFFIQEFSETKIRFHWAVIIGLIAVSVGSVFVFEYIIKRIGSKDLD